jgi:hypothetical protein
MTELPPQQPNDLLGEAIDQTRFYLSSSLDIHDRIRNLWAAAVAARDLGASDVIAEQFFRLAYDSVLAADLTKYSGRHADEELHHVIRWGLLGRNPFHRRDRST